MKLTPCTLLYQAGRLWKNYYENHVFLMLQIITLSEILSINMQWWLWFDSWWNSWKHSTAQLSWPGDAENCKYIISIEHYTDSIYFVRCLTLNSIWLKVKCLNSLGVSDLLHQYIMRTQQMSLQGKRLLHCCMFYCENKVTLSIFLSFVQFICHP